MLCQVVDFAIRAHGGAGVTDDFGLAWAYAVARAIRIIRMRCAATDREARTAQTCPTSGRPDGTAVAGECRVKICHTGAPGLRSLVTLRTDNQLGESRSN